jgi:sugar lactone lactonase YvrE
VYVADYDNHRIRKITSAGVVTTLAGSGTGTFADGTGTSASFRNPYGVAVDSSGNVYVADQLNQRIRKITSAGVVTTLAGNGTAAFADGTGTSARFNSPQGVAVDSAGNVYVADYNNQRIRKITSAGVVTTLAGQTTPGSTDGTGTNARFNGPTGIAVTSGGILYVVDSDNNRIRKIV